MNEGTAPFDILFENSWEVCNKIGGIYTVLSTKAKTLQTLYKDKTIFVGPDVWSDDNPSPYFIPQPSVLKAWRSRAELPYGIEVRCGRWDIPGKPIVVLVKFDTMYAHKDEFYAKMWELYKVDSLHAYGDYDEACAFALASAIVIESICDWMRAEHFSTSATDVPSKLRRHCPAIIAHFDEWTTGMGLLYTQWRQPSVATIFTTHATSIGRSICGNGKPLYDYMRGYNGDQMAGELNMHSKHSLEKAAAQAADCFTTVSDVTAIECEQLLERRPDIVTPNGFEKGFVPAKSKFEGVRTKAREALLNIASSLTGVKLPEDTFLVATSGRCEYRNKGIDVYLDALTRLAATRTHADTPVVAFVLVPAWAKEAREDLKAALRLKNKKHALPEPYITHTLNNPDQDPIIGRIRQLGLTLTKDNLTVIYVPCYLNGSDGILDRTYYDTLIGLDATVFPSYYEPWGYTPLESVAFGVPTITTSLSGFGQWVLNCFGDAPSFDNCGVNVIRRTDSNYDDVASGIARSLEWLLTHRDSKATISRSATETSAMAAWAYFIDYYVVAFTMALDNSMERYHQNAECR